jgi:putative addiction module component (TIGR02574 family)
MIDKIENETQFNEAIALIEKFINKATQGGGFSSLTTAEAEELNQLSLMAEQYEDQILADYDHWKDENFLKELKSRLDDFESGKDEGIPWEEVKRKSRERLKRHSS